MSKTLPTHLDDDTTPTNTFRGTRDTVITRRAEFFDFDGQQVSRAAPVGHLLVVRAFGVWYAAEIVRRKHTSTLVVSFRSNVGTLRRKECPLNGRDPRCRHDPVHAGRVG